MRRLRELLRSRPCMRLKLRLSGSQKSRLACLRPREWLKSRPVWLRPKEWLRSRPVWPRLKGSQTSKPACLRPNVSKKNRPVWLRLNALQRNKPVWLKPKEWPRPNVSKKNKPVWLRPRPRLRLSRPQKSKLASWRPSKLPKSRLDSRLRKPRPAESKLSKKTRKSNRPLMRRELDSQPSNKEWLRLKLQRPYNASRKRLRHKGNSK